MKPDTKRPFEKQFCEHSRRWKQHFLRNRNHMQHVPWDRRQTLTADEREAISKSIATFQLGENSEGNSFVRAGRAYAQRTGDFEYLEALKLFIKEEQNHSAVLKRFMVQHDIPTITKEWTDSGFRFVRKLAGLNVCITVLITAEIIAAVYYRALGQATQSPVLKAICGQILVDEAHHLRFQAGTLAKERVSWNPVKRWFFSQLHRVFLMLTILIVWKEHRQVYRAGRLSFFQWVAMTWSVLEDVLRTINIGVRPTNDGQFNLPLPPHTPITHYPELPSMHGHAFALAAPSQSLNQIEGLQEISSLLE